MASTQDGNADHPETLAELLNLEQLDRNLYRGRNPATALQRKALYGGQVAAQALMAAGLTVEPDRLPHSLHGYFLRPGIVDRPVILRVDIDRDGRSFSGRHVAAIQDGEVIFSMLASFHVGTETSTLDSMDNTDARPPEECPDRSFEAMVDMKEVTVSEIVDGRKLNTDCLWVRSSTPLDDDPLTHACGLAYMSDLGTGFGRTPADVGISGPSLDHAVWFHEHGRADEWILLHMWPRKAIGRRGVYDGAMRDQSGKLCAMLAQECLLRKD